MKSDHSILGNRGGFELAGSATLAAVSIVAASVGAALPLGAALAAGALAAWVGHYLDCHYARGDVSRWRTFGLAATLAAALGWTARLLVDPSRRPPDDSAPFFGGAIVVTVAILAASAACELRENRQR